MKREQLRHSIFFLLISLSLVLPVIVELVISPDYSVATALHIPYQIGSWRGKDFQVPQAVNDSYRQKQCVFSFREYACPGAAPIFSVIQQATNYENVHDLYRCLELSEMKPRRVSEESLGGNFPGQATVVQFRQRNTPHYALFCYQTKAGAACYPPKDLLERARLSLLSRRPCRLIELTTPVGTDAQATMSSLKELASRMSAQPM
jgi:hypothetical protein